MRRLLPLALAMFAVGTDGFIIAGLLPQISADLQVDASTAGQLVTAFAVTFAVSAPLLGAVTSGLDRRVTLLAALAVFVLGNVVTALGDTYGLVLAARVGTAVGAGSIGATAFSCAIAMTPPDRRGRALALVMGGLTVSVALGLPAGTLIGSADWRLTLWVVAGVGLVAAAGIARSLPSIALPRDTLRARLAPLRETWVQGVLAVTVIALAGTHLLYTYIAAALAGATGGSTTALTVVLLAWGLGIALGGALGGTALSLGAPPAWLGIPAAAVTAVGGTLTWATVRRTRIGTPHQA